MSSEIDIRSDNEEPQPQPAGGGDLLAWAYAAQKAHEIALVLAETAFVPESMFRRPGEVTAAILAGQELDMSPMMALQSIDIIERRPAMRALALRGLLLAHGHETWVEESTATRAVVCGQRKGSTRIERSVWTMDRATKAGLAGKKNWQKQPTSMLVARATAEVARLVAADVLIGMPYIVEELNDDGPELPDSTPQAQAPPEPKKRRTAQRAKPVVAQVDPQALPGDMPAPPADEQQRPTVVSEAKAAQTLESAGFEVVDVIDTMRPASEMPSLEDDDVEVLADTCDITMPHDMRKPAPMGCPPNCPTRQAAERELNGNQQPVDAPQEYMSDAQRKRMNVEMRRVGLVERDERLAFVAHVIGREVATSNELTVGEASEVITALVAEGLDDVRTTYGQKDDSDDGDNDGEAV
jgi:hypothetical protein